MDFKDLHSNRISLVKINENGLIDMHEYSTQSEFYKFLEFNTFNSIEETKKYLYKLINRTNSKKYHYWFIRLNEKDKIIGTFGLLNIDIRKGSAEIGYGLSPDYWGCGYFKETLFMILEYLFEELKFHRICAKTQSNNISSIIALEKSGFNKEGIMRDFYLSSNGKRYDAVLLSILKEKYYQ